MQTKPKSNSVITHAVSADGKRVVFTVLGHGDVELDLTKVSAECMQQAAIHGWIQRISDAAAIERADKDGNIIPTAELTRIKYERMNDLCTHYESGTTEWKRNGGGDGSGARSLTILAIARVKEVDYARAEEMVGRHAEMHTKGDRKKALALLRKSAKVQAAMQEIRDERASRAASDVDVDAMLNEME